MPIVNEIATALSHLSLEMKRFLRKALRGLNQ